MGVDLEQEDNVSRFVGVPFEIDPKIVLLEMKHTVLIQRVIEAVGLDDGMPKGQFAPSEAKPLVKDDNYEP